jgi:hypothetical protein
MTGNCCDLKDDAGCCKSPGILTDEEASALERMREIRNQSTPIMNRLDEIKRNFEHITPPSETISELNDLKLELDILREKWSEWQVKLDYAMTKKLIALGHITPPT